MLKYTVPVLAAAFAFAPAALAEQKTTVTLSHVYDAALLSSEDGARSVLSELESAARRTCTSRIPASGGLYTDKACAETLVLSAVRQMHADQVKAGAPIAPGFEQIALTQLASAD